MNVIVDMCYSLRCNKGGDRKAVLFVWACRMVKRVRRGLCADRCASWGAAQRVSSGRGLSSASPDPQDTHRRRKRCGDEDRVCQPERADAVRQECQVASGRSGGAHREQHVKMARNDEQYASLVEARITGKPRYNYRPIISDKQCSFTITSSGQFYRRYDKSAFSQNDYRNMSTFPQDYDFGDQQPQYICGMSVPPVMMAQVATVVYEQWFDRE